MLALLALALAFAWPVQTVGWNAASHYALVRALDQGTARIDAYRSTTGDVARYRGHWYSARAPGLALWELPAYKLLKAAGAARAAPVAIGGRYNDRTIWLLGLWGAVLPAALLLVLVRAVGERLAPGTGTAAAVTLGVATLVLPFATLLFSHVAAATLAFAAFAVLFFELERARPPRLSPIATAGLLVGLAVTTEYATFLVGVVLGVYAMLGRGRERRPRALLARGGAYAAGVAAGLVPLALYNRWAFGSFTHVAYADIPEQQAGFFGIGAPRPAVAVQLLLSSRGLLTLAPVLVVAAIGVVVLHRRGRRAEALAIAAIGLALLIYNSGYFLPFGGGVPGPRFLIAALPFLALGLTLAWRRLPGPTLSLAAAGAVAMLVATMTKPRVLTEADTGVWMRMLERGHLEPTAATALGVHDLWLAWAPVLAALAAAVVLAARASPAGRLSARQLALGAAAAGAWALFAALGPAALGIDRAAARIMVGDGIAGATREPYGSRPIAALVLLALAAALLALAVAGVRSRAARRRR